MIEVLNMRKGSGFTHQKGDIRIDRTTPFGNPFIIDRNHSRIQVVDMFREWITLKPELVEQLRELDPKRLVCWCAPKVCHGDVLVELLND